MRTLNHIDAMKQLASLEAWKCANALARSAYRLTLQAPLSRHFGLSDQIRRAAVSVPANLVEGYALGTTMQFVRASESRSARRPSFTAIWRSPEIWASWPTERNRS